MIAVLGAMAIEIETLKAQMCDVLCQTHFGQVFFTGTLRGVPIVLTCCGVGKVNAARAAQLCISTYPVKLMLNTGVAGGLLPALSAGSVVISSALVQHDVDTSALGDPVGFVSGCDLVYFAADVSVAASLLVAAEKVAPGSALMGVIASGDGFIADKEKNDAIRSTFSAAAVDMESAAIAQICHLCTVPFAAVRTISDGANEDSPMDFPTLAAMAARNAEGILLEFISASASDWM